MVAIIGCESSYIHYRPDGTVLRGRVTPADSGAAQINKHYHEEAAEDLGYDVDTLWGNLAYARHLYDALGESQWVCSRMVARQ